MKLAIFGGTFDPIHNAHLTVAREAISQFGLDRVLFVPAAHPPHKADAACAPFEHRLRMAELACAGDPALVASPLEASDERSYSIRTIERVAAGLAPGDEMFFLIGADAFAEIGSWYRAADALRAVRFIVATRPGHDYATPAGARVDRLDTLALPVSSSEIRERLAAGEAPEELPPAVLDYIREHGLYRPASH